jgi:hypothetical protein
MNKLIKGIIAGVILTPLLFCVTFDTASILTDNVFEKEYQPCRIRNHETDWSRKCYDEYCAKHPMWRKVGNFLINPGFGLGLAPTFGIYFPLSGRCVKTGSKLKNGFTAKGRDYFECNKVQIFVSDVIFGPNGERLFEKGT